MSSVYSPKLEIAQSLNKRVDKQSLSVNAGKQREETTPNASKIP